MFKREEAFNFIKNFLQIENAESRMETDKRNLLDEILFTLQNKIPFQNISLLSVPPNERRKPTDDEMKANYTSGVGGLCFDLNISTYHLLAAVGFEITMLHCTVSTTTIFPRNHVLMIARNIERKGDSYLLDTASGHPTFGAISLDFEKESPVYINSYLEYKFIKHEGELLRMQRKGDPLTTRGVQENSDLEFWLDGWRRFYTVELSIETKDSSKFAEYHREVYVNPTASPFHLSQRAVIFPHGKAAMVINNKTYRDIDGELVITEIEGGDEAILSKIKEICPNLPQDLLPKSLLHWRQTESASK